VDHVLADEATSLIEIDAESLGDLEVFDPAHEATVERQVRGENRIFRRANSKVP